MFTAFTPLVDTIYSVLDGPYDVATYVMVPLDALEMRLVNEQVACMCFLLDVDGRMGDVQHAWQAHKKRGVLNVCVPTAVTNDVLRDVEMLFQALSANRPYLQDMEHILALLMCGDALLEMVTRHAVSFQTAAGLLMVARRVKTPTLRRTALGVLVHELHTTLLTVEPLVARIQALMDVGTFWHLDWTTCLGKSESVSALHADLREFITFTQLQPDQRIVVDPMMFGRSWNESEWRVSRTSELYQTFFANILPTLISHALQDGADAWLELEAGMMPFPNLVHEYVHTLTVLFLMACQSLLWSILYTQGALSDAISCAEVAKSTSIALARLSFQLERCRKNGDGLFVQPYVPMNIDNALGWLTHRMLASAPSNSFAPFEMDRAWFSPYMAEQNLLMISMLIGLDMGLATMDDIGQTRHLLHLYNALRILDKIPANADLDNLVRVVETRTHVVWPDGGPSVRGGLAIAHFRAWGYDAATAKLLAADLCLDATGNGMHATRDWMHHHNASRKKMKQRGGQKPAPIEPITPAELSQGFRYVTSVPPNEDGVDHVAAMTTALVGDYDAFLYMKLNVVGQLFREAWAELNTALGYHGSRHLSADRDAIPDSGRMYNENLCVQTLLGLCDQSPDDPRLLVAAKALTKLGKDMSEAYIHGTDFGAFCPFLRRQ